MLLRPEQTERFYRVWLPLLKFVNDRADLLPDLQANSTTEGIGVFDAIKVRNKLWENEALLDRYIAENQADLSPEDLDLLASWHNKVVGNFYVFRYLKKYSIFIAEKTPNRAYGVLGLYSPIEDLVKGIAGSSLPVFIKTVLLPFEGQIITDGLIQTYKLHFGPGIRDSLKEVYRIAQERERIITSLEPNNVIYEDYRKEISGRNTRLLKAFSKDLATYDVSFKMVKQHSENIERFGREYLLTQEPPRQLSEMTLPDVQAFLDLPGHKSSRFSLRRFAQFLYNTGHIDTPTVFAFNQYLKFPVAD
jgi:hypothetical protein